jgi:hypothetical protein
MLARHVHAQGDAGNRGFCSQKNPLFADFYGLMRCFHRTTEPRWLRTRLRRSPRRLGREPTASLRHRYARASGELVFALTARSRGNPRPVRHQLLPVSRDRLQGLKGGASRRPTRLVSDGSDATGGRLTGAARPTRPRRQGGWAEPSLQHAEREFLGAARSPRRLDPRQAQEGARAPRRAPCSRGRMGPGR